MDRGGEEMSKEVDIDEVDLIITTRIYKDPPGVSGAEIHMRAKLTEGAKARIKQHYIKRSEVEKMVDELEVHAHPDDQKYADSTVEVCKAVLKRKLRTAIKGEKE